jgi:DNA anti-recombination protein RmuC
MAELTELDEKIGEVYGLAQAAQNATEKVSKLVDDEQIASVLQQMHQEAAETEQRCEELASELDGKKTAIQDKARETKQEAEQMMKDYLGSDADGLDGLEFLIMAEAGELGHVEIVGAMNEQVGEPKV